MMHYTTHRTSASESSRKTPLPALLSVTGTLPVRLLYSHLGKVAFPHRHYTNLTKQYLINYCCLVKLLPRIGVPTPLTLHGPRHC